MFGREQLSSTGHGEVLIFFQIGLEAFVETLRLGL